MGRGGEEEKGADRAAPSTCKAEGIGRDEQGSAGRRLENRASSSRRRAGTGRAERRDGGGTGRAERRDTQINGKGRGRQGRKHHGRAG